MANDRTPKEKRAHVPYQTTQKYINLARQLKPAMQALYVPDLKVATTA